MNFRGGGAPANNVPERTSVLKFLHFYNFFTPNVSLYKNSNKRHKYFGFTMAEVLITLGILGVVVAMTMPGMIRHFHNVERSTALKKAYNILSQALLISQEEHGDPRGWERAPYHKDGMKEWSNEYIFKYIKQIASCEDSYEKKCPTTGSKICQSEDPSSCNSYGLRMNIYVLADGMNVYIYGGGNPVDGKTDFLHVMVDVNGISKPNQYGKDVFVFTISLNSDYAKISPWAEATNREKARNNCISASALCMGLVFWDNFEFKKDYPWHY